MSFNRMTCCSLAVDCGVIGLILRINALFYWWNVYGYLVLTVVYSQVVLKMWETS